MIREPFGSAIAIARPAFRPVSRPRPSLIMISLFLTSHTHETSLCSDQYLMDVPLIVGPNHQQEQVVVTVPDVEVGNNHILACAYRLPYLSFLRRSPWHLPCSGKPNRKLDRPQRVLPNRQMLINAILEYDGDEGEARP